MNLENITLANGLNTLFIDSPHSNVTTAQIWFKAGSSLEDSSNQGIAHFLEHMFFKGTQKYPDIMIPKTVESYGGEINAFTSFDYTCYYINSPSNEILTTVDVLLDMTCNPSFLERDIIPEKDVVFEEFRRSIDTPSQFNFSKIQKSSFPRSYSRAILGTEKTIKSFTKNQLNEFRNQYYNLENALLIVAGNLQDKTKIINKINHYTLPHGIKSSFPKFKLKKKSSLNIHSKSVNYLTLTLAIQAPDYTNIESPTEDLAINCLAFGDISPLYKEMVTQNPIASGLSGSTMFFAHGGCHFIRFVFPEKNASFFTKQLLKTMKNILISGFTQDDIERIRNQYIASKVYEKETIESVAFSMGHAYAQTGSFDSEELFIKQMKSISKSQIHKTLINIFKREIHLTLQTPLHFKNEKLNLQMKNLNKEINALADYGRIKDLSYKMTSSRFDPEVKSLEIKKGITLIHRQNKLTPTFAMHIYLKGGLAYENNENNGTYHLLANTLAYGHKESEYHSLKSELEKKSSYINGFSGRNAYGLTLHGLSEHTDALINHLMKLLTTPSFPSQYIKLEKELIKRSLHNRKEDPVKKCFQEFNKLVFNKHPYSQEMIGTEKSLKKITKKSISELHQESLKSQELVITYCGDLEFETVIDKLSSYIKELTPRKSKKSLNKNTLKPIFNKRVPIQFEREQTHIVIGKSSFKSGTKEDLYLRILTIFLSGQSSELFVEVRDRKGLCYSVQPLQNTSLEAGYWGIYIAAGHEKKDLAIKAIKAILNKYQKSGFNKKNFNMVKKMIRGQNLISIQTNDDYANFYSIGVLHNLGLDFQHESFQEIDQLPLKDFNTFLSNFLVDNWNIVEVGKV